MGIDKTGLEVLLPDRRPSCLKYLVCDFTGTSSRDGRLLPGVAIRLRKLAHKVCVLVVTADTFGTARHALAGLPVEVRIVRTGRDKARLVEEIGPNSVAAIGNGRNDVAMFRKVKLGISVVGPEGCAAELLAVADIVAHDIRDALDLLIHPLRMTATLRK
jgi:soluble P-type ATPase